MNETPKQKELYIADIRWNTHFKRICFEGPATKQAAELFGNITEKTGEMALSASSWEAHLTAVRANYQDFGFFEVHP